MLVPPDKTVMDILSSDKYKITCLQKPEVDKACNETWQPLSLNALFN